MQNFFSNTTKSAVLQGLEDKLKSAIVLSQVSFSAAEWKKNQEKIIAAIHKKFFNNKLVVRSSAVAEDSASQSLAGHFDSVLNVSGEKKTIEAINKVIKSFLDKNPKNRVFVQPMLENVKISGVVFTKDPNNNAPYIVMNYDDSSGRTDSVTAGDSNNLKTFYCHKLHNKKFGDFRDKILSLCFELEKITKQNALDIEFAIDKRNKLYLFQVRPLIIVEQNAINQEEHYKILQTINLRLKSWMTKHPYLCGDKAIYGVMPDWNPAEIIGIKPTPLAVSLYREVITNSIWAYQRDNYGYRNLRSFPLLVELEGMPYIDVRVSFNSFIPASLNEKIAQKLANYYLQKLANNPALHDKVEFEIVFSCFTFNASDKISALEEQGFSHNEVFQIKKSLLDLTNKIISPETGLWKDDLKKIEILKTRHIEIIKGDLDDYAKLYWLIEDCKRYGTLPFAGLARAAFIAVELLKSMVKKNLLTQDEYDCFLVSLNTISSSISKDFCKLSKKSFLEKYGHLRPGTYDILSKRYDEDADSYFDWSCRTRHNERSLKFELSKEKLDKIQEALDENGFKIEVRDLLDFCKGAIEAREYSKFIFTKSLSDFLRLYGDIAVKELKISLQDASYTHVNSLMSLASNSSDPKKIITTSIERRKKRFEATRNINLPALIISHDDVFAFYELESRPNYITQNKTNGEVKILQNSDKSIAGKIVMIPSADPGYDWIFSHKIKALITKYGGVNSHMAIRAAELNIPAIIGAGKFYDRWSLSKRLEMDCLNKKVTAI